ncbi:MAG: hypothetical protein JWP81_3365 [Ferruginibacter sp.]|nr:hypothetical protein [Ferruginibacter sp.]
MIARYSEKTGGFHRGDAVISTISGDSGQIYQEISFFEKPLG